MNDEKLVLPTAEEYRENAMKTVIPQFAGEWSQPKYQCPKCGGGMCKNLMMVLTTHPVQYSYTCHDCGYTETQFV